MTTTLILEKLQDKSISINERFDLIENYTQKVEGPKEVISLIEIYEKEENSVLRHEISAQLLQINTIKPQVIKPIINQIEDFLINVSRRETSIIAKHEAIESLSSIGTKKGYQFLSKLLHVETNKDILDTIALALSAINARLRIDLTRNPT